MLTSGSYTPSPSPVQPSGSSAPPTGGPIGPEDIAYMESHPYEPGNRGGLSSRGPSSGGTNFTQFDNEPVNPDQFRGQVWVRGDQVWYEGQLMPGRLSDVGRPVDREQATQQIITQGLRTCSTGVCATGSPPRISAVYDLTRPGSGPSTPPQNTVPALAPRATSYFISTSYSPPIVEDRPKDRMDYVLSDPLTLLESKRDLAGKYYGTYEPTTEGVYRFLEDHPQYTIPEAQAAVLGYASERASKADVDYARSELDRTIRDMRLPDFLSEDQKNRIALIAAETQKYGQTRARQEGYGFDWGRIPVTERNIRQADMWGTTIYTEPFTQMIGRYASPEGRFGAEFAKAEGQRSILADIMQSEFGRDYNQSYDSLRSGISRGSILTLMRGSRPETSQHINKWGSDYQYSTNLLGELYSQIRPESGRTITGTSPTTRSNEIIPFPIPGVPIMRPEPEKAQTMADQFREGTMSTRIENRMNYFLNDQKWTPELAKSLFGSLNEKFIQPMAYSAVPLYGAARSISKSIPKAVSLR